METTSVTNIMILLTFSFLLLLPRTAAYDGLFYMQRIPSACVETTLNMSADGNISDNCFTFDWHQIRNYTTNYTTYIDTNTNQTYYAQIGALTVLGNIDNYYLNYQCPPTGYNGVAPGCQTPNNTQLVVLHINVADGKLYAIDIILSGTPFPSPQSLMNNQPPFGKASHMFSSGVTIQSTGYFKICKSKNSSQCPNTNLDANQLPYPLPSNNAFGIFGIQSLNSVTNSTWIMDDPNQLLIVTAGNTYYYFNGSGFFTYDSNLKTCIWSPACNYQCEIYNYNSRFLDYAGDWIITNKWGVPNMEPVAVQAWIGNAIDAAGIFPIIMYTDQETGHYLGLDKLDPSPGPRMGATYWYVDDDTTKPKTDIAAFHPNVVDTNCTGNFNNWFGAQNNSQSLLRPDNLQMIVVLLFLIYVLSIHPILP